MISDLTPILLIEDRSDQAFKRYVLRSEQAAAIEAFYRAIGEEEDGGSEEDRKE
jgi:hypothetical protein